MTNATQWISDAQIDQALRNIRAKIQEDQDGDFNPHAVQAVIEHSPSSGPVLLHEMARASLGILPAERAESIITNRSKALYGFVALQKRVGVERLQQHLQNTIWTCADFASTINGIRR